MNTQFQNLKPFSIETPNVYEPSHIYPVYLANATDWDQAIVNAKELIPAGVFNLATPSKQFVAVDIDSILANRTNHLNTIKPYVSATQFKNTTSAYDRMDTIVERIPVILFTEAQATNLYIKGYDIKEFLYALNDNPQNIKYIVYDCERLLEILNDDTAIAKRRQLMNVRTEVAANDRFIDELLSNGFITDEDAITLDNYLNTEKGQSLYSALAIVNKYIQPNNKNSQANLMIPFVMSLVYNNIKNK